MMSVKKQCIDKSNLGKATVTPSRPVVAGSFITIKYTYQVNHPIDDSGYIKIVFRFASDMGTPQFNHPAELNFCSVSTTGDCQLISRWDPKGHIRPWGKSLYLKVTSGYLDKGDIVTVVFGDTSGGSVGWQTQTFCEDTFEFKTLVDPIASYQFKELPQSPTLRIVAGEPSRAICIGPSMVELNKPFYYQLKLEDVWGNPVGRPKRIKHLGFKESGVYHVNATDSKTGLTAESNPIEAVKTKPALKPYWADFHGQSEETIGSNSIDDYLLFARDKALLDISGHQGNDFQITDKLWEKINTLSEEYTEPGRFVVFPGYEWSGNTPLGGDRNIYFANNKGEITRSSNELLPRNTSQYPVSATAEELFRNLNKQKSCNPFSFAHVGGRYANMNMHDPNFEVAVEIHSAWGTFEWLLADAFENGYRVGICANSDGHKGRPGASYPGASKFGSYGGLTCVLAKKLDRKNIYDAVKKRHLYATTGNRALLDVSVTTEDGKWVMMGDVLEKFRGIPLLNIKVHATAPIDYIEIRNGVDVIKTVRPFTKYDLGSSIKIVWSGAKVKGRDRMVDWSGSLKIKGNKIKCVAPVNFWKPDSQPKKISNTEVVWNSVTTGGIAGLILYLEKSGSGRIEINTKPKKCRFDVSSVKMTPKTHKAGGVQKQIQIYRLSDPCRQMKNMNCQLPLSKLTKGDNPIYIKIVQRDGHIIWSSPIYIVR